MTIGVISDEINLIAAGTLAGLTARAYRTQPSIDRILVIIAPDAGTAIDMLETAIADEHPAFLEANTA